MFLSDVDIRHALERQEIELRDFDPKRLQPASYDILFGNRFVVNDAQATQWSILPEASSPRPANLLSV
jgi:deoxycytidine triphosphate deaminase